MARFQDIIGNHLIKEHFIHAIASGKVSHGYIISGEDGMGKNMFANAFANLLLCEHPKDGVPCGECTACKQIDSGNHPDVICVRHEKPNSIGVDDIRYGLNEDIQIKPYSSEYKIYIVDEAEKMTVQAQNALLKTLEEPPAYAVILLLTSNGDTFLPTILSRCVILKMKNLSDAQVRQFLMPRGLEERELETIVKFARGNIGKALKFADSEEFGNMISNVMYLLEHVHEMEFQGLLQMLEKLSEYKLSIRECLDFMQMWYRDVLLFKVTNEINLLVFKEEYKYIRESAKKSSFDGIERIITAIDQARRRLDANVNFELTMELLLLTIKEN